MASSSVAGPFLTAAQEEVQAVDPVLASVPKAALPEHPAPVAPCIPRVPSPVVDLPEHAPALDSVLVREPVPASASVPVRAAQLDSFRLLVRRRVRSVQAASHAAVASNIRRPRKAR